MRKKGRGDEHIRRRLMLQLTALSNMIPSVLKKELTEERPTKKAVTGKRTSDWVQRGILKRQSDGKKTFLFNICPCHMGGGS